MTIRKLLRIIGLLVAGLLIIVVLAGGTVHFLAQNKLKRLHDVTVRPVTVPTGEEAIARGRHIALTRACLDCHGEDYGGRSVINSLMAGKVDGSNITRGRGGLSADYSDLDYVRAIRHGLTREGRGLVLMPSLEYEGMSDEDLGVLIAYLKSLPPVDRERGPVALGPITKLLLLTGEFILAAEHIDHAGVRPASVEPAVTPAYGRYLAASCTGCHGHNLAGGRIPASPPDWPAAANLTPHSSTSVSGWSEQDFINVMRTLRRPDGRQLHPIMPAAYANMTDLELKALWTYLRTLDPLAGVQ